MFLVGVLDRAECRVRLHIGDVDRARTCWRRSSRGPSARCSTRGRAGARRPDAVRPLLAALLPRGADDDPRRHLESVAPAARAAEGADLPAARRMLAEVAGFARREGATPFLDEGFDIRELVDVVGRRVRRPAGRSPRRRCPGWSSR